MLELFKSEYSRYKKFAWLASILILAAYGFIARLKPFLDHEPLHTSIANMVLIGGAFAFGILQMALHKRQNYWVYLVHRPLSIYKIYLSLTYAGFCLLALVIVLPWLIVVSSLDFFTSTVVDTRHYIYIVFTLLISILAYFIGQLLTLSASKGVLALTLMIFGISSPSYANNTALLLPVTLISLGILYLNIHSFKPDLTTFIQKPLYVLVMTLFMSISFHTVLYIGIVLIDEAAGYITGSVQKKVTSKDTINYMWQLPLEDQVRFVLENNDQQMSHTVGAQINILEPENITTQKLTFLQSRMGQLHIEDKYQKLSIKEDGTIWQFSHNSRLIEGRDKVTGQLIGIIGTSGFIDRLSDITEAEKFIHVPYLLPQSLIVTRSEVVHVNYTDRSITRLYGLTKGEFYRYLPYFGKNTIVFVTNERTLAFDTKKFINEQQITKPKFVVPHPTLAENITHIYTYEMAQGTLLFYVSNNHFGFDRPGAEAIFTDNEEVISLGRREFTLHTRPDLIRHLYHALSPVLNSLAWSVFNPISAHPYAMEALERYFDRRYPRQVVTFVLITHLISGVITLLLSRFGHRHNILQATTWAALVATLGLPAFCSYMFLNPWPRFWPMKNKPKNHELKTLTPQK